MARTGKEYKTLNEAVDDEELWRAIVDGISIPIKNGGEKYESGKIETRWETKTTGLTESSWTTANTNFFNVDQVSDTEAVVSWLKSNTERFIEEDFNAGGVKITFRHSPSGDYLSSKQFRIKSLISDTKREADQLKKYLEEELGRMQQQAVAFTQMANGNAMLMREGSNLVRAHADWARTHIGFDTQEEVVDERRFSSILEILGKFAGLVNEDFKEKADNVVDAANAIEMGMMAANANSSAAPVEEPRKRRFFVKDKDGKKFEITDPEEIREYGYDPDTGERLPESVSPRRQDPEEQIQEEQTELTPEQFEELMMEYAKQNPERMKKLAKEMIKKDMIPGVPSTVASMIP